jgi:predicted nucleotidyltransferase
LIRLADVARAIRVGAPEHHPLLVGAAARDLLLVYAHDLPIARKTLDIDLAFGVSSWEEFNHLQARLTANGEFEEDRSFQGRMRFQREVSVDFLPFGDLEGADRTIAFPPGGRSLSVIGFREARRTAIKADLPKGESLLVASPPALALLKIFAWRDRADSPASKHASDLWLLLRHYSEIQDESRVRRDTERLLEHASYDWRIAGAWLLGVDVRRLILSDVSTDPTLDLLERILEPETLSGGQLNLVSKMDNRSPESALNLLTAFLSGLKGEEHLYWFSRKWNWGRSRIAS